MEDLDHLLAQRAAHVAVPDTLMARILADAAREQPQPFTFSEAPQRPAPKAGFWALLADMFGGSGALAGLATAACAGIYLGAMQPSALNAVTVNLAGVLSGTSAMEQLDFMPSIDVLLAEE